MKEFIYKILFCLVLIFTFPLVNFFADFYHDEYGKYPVYIEYKEAIGVTLLTTNDQIKQSAVLSFTPPKEKEDVEVQLPKLMTESHTLKLPKAYNNGTMDIYVKIKIIPNWLSFLSDEKT